MPASRARISVSPAGRPQRKRFQWNSLDKFSGLTFCMKMLYYLQTFDKDTLILPAFPVLMFTKL